MEIVGKTHTKKNTRETTGSQIFFLFILLCLIFPVGLLEIESHIIIFNRTDTPASTGLKMAIQHQTVPAASNENPATTPHFSLRPKTLLFWFSKIYLLRNGYLCSFFSGARTIGGVGCAPCYRCISQPLQFLQINGALCN